MCAVSTLGPAILGCQAGASSSCVYMYEGLYDGRWGCNAVCHICQVHGVRVMPCCKGAVRSMVLHMCASAICVRRAFVKVKKVYVSRL